MMIDTTHTIELPEGIDLELRPAGPLIRSLAWGIDALLRLLVYITGLLVFFQFSVVLSPRVLGSLMTIGLFLLEWFYPVYFERFNQGATPGKRWLGIKVVHANGSPVGFSASMIRNLLRTADFFPGMYLSGLLCMLFDARFRRLGDMAAGTLVIYAPERRAAVAPARKSGSVALIPLSLEDQQWIIRFAEEQHRLSPERRMELADLLHPLTRLQGEPAVDYLCRASNELIGYR